MSTAVTFSYSASSGYPKGGYLCNISKLNRNKQKLEEFCHFDTFWTCVTRKSRLNLSKALQFCNAMQK